MKRIILFTFIFCSAFSFSQIGNRAANTNSSFLPDPGKYIISAWVKENNNDNIQKISYQSYIRVNMLGVNLDFYPSGRIIDGWQRIIGIFEISPYSSVEDNQVLFNIQLSCSPSTLEAYFDDVRFYPYNGNMKSFVYDEDTQRLMAELDENNYATFYEYDLEGGLVRVKKETERGVFTIQETRSNNPKKDE